jgi:hypothetical protein
MPVEQRCTDLGANCLCSQPMNAPTYTELQANTYWAPDETSAKPCSMSESEPGAVISYDQFSYQVESSGAMFSALPNLDPSIDYFLRTTSGAGGGFHGHEFPNSAPDGRISLRWYRYHSSDWVISEPGGACPNSSKISELFTGGITALVWDYGGNGNNLLYGWGTRWNLSDGFDCCNFGPGPNGGEVAYNETLMRGKWWMYEIAVDNPLSTGGTTVVRSWRRNITDDDPEEEVIDTSVVTNQQGTATNWASAQATTLKPDSRIAIIADTPFRNGTCPGYYGFSHYLAAAWDTAAGQRIGAAEEIEGGAADTTPPTLSSANDGTPTTQGCTGASVSTDEANGTLYWAVVTNGGSCTDAQLKAGSGGNIVSGKAGNQAVSGTGTQTIATITGLNSNTSYDIKFLHSDAAANDSSQASADLATTWPGTQTIYWTEPFTNTSFAARGWYGVSGAGAGIDAGAGHWTWDNGDFEPNEGYPSNRLLDSNTIPEMTLTTPTIYASFSFKVGTNWSNTDPHYLNFLTNSDSNPEFNGGSPSTLDIICQTIGLKARAYCTDEDRIVTGTILGDSYPHNNATPTLIGTTQPCAAMGGNGFQTGVTSAFYAAGSNAHNFDSAANVFTPNTFHTVEFYLKMNSFSGGAPVADGVIKYWVDGNLVVNMTSVVLRTPGYENQEFGRVMLIPFLQPASGAQEMWMDTLLIANQPLGDGGGVPGAVFKSYSERRRA